jgi:hypothetical protein
MKKIMVLWCVCFISINSSFADDYNQFDIKNVLPKLTEYLGKERPVEAHRIRIGEYMVSLGQANISVLGIGVNIIYKTSEGLVNETIIQFYDASSNYGARNPDGSHDRISWTIQLLLNIADQLGEPTGLNRSEATWTKGNIIYVMDQRPVEASGGGYFFEFSARRR